MIFFCGWLVILYAGADHPPPPGFIAVVLIDLVAAFVVYRRVPVYAAWSQTRRPQRWLWAAIDGIVAGLFIAGLALLLPFGGEPSIRRSAPAVATWCGMLASVGAANAILIFGLSAASASRAGGHDETMPKNGPGSSRKSNEDGSAVNRFLGLIMLIGAFALAGCIGQTGDFMPASAISRDGFARDGAAMRALDGQVVKLWGFVDSANLYGDAGAQEILGDWWSGPGPDDATWRFNLKGNADDAVGHSFPVHVPNDPGRDDLLERFVADARAQQPTKVFVTGKLFTFDAPANIAARTGLTMELASSADILLDAPEGGDDMAQSTAKPAYVTALEAAYGPPSQAGFGSAVFYEPDAGIGDLPAWALEKYKFFTGDLWERYGEDAWLGPWRQVYWRPDGVAPDIVAELRSIDDADAALSVEMILDNIEDPEAARAALAGVFDDPAMREVVVFNLGDSAAMSGVLVAGRRTTGEAVFLLFLLD